MSHLTEAGHREMPVGNICNFSINMDVSSCWWKLPWVSRDLDLESSDQKPHRMAARRLPGRLDLKTALRLADKSLHDFRPKPSLFEMRIVSQYARHVCVRSLSTLSWLLRLLLLLHHFRLHASTFVGRLEPGLFQFICQYS